MLRQVAYILGAVVIHPSNDGMGAQHLAGARGPAQAHKAPAGCNGSDVDPVGLGCPVDGELIGDDDGRAGHPLHMSQRGRKCPASWCEAVSAGLPHTNGCQRQCMLHDAEGQVVVGWVGASSLGGSWGSDDCTFLEEHSDS